MSRAALDPASTAVTLVNLRASGKANRPTPAYRSMAVEPVTSPKRGIDQRLDQETVDLEKRSRADAKRSEFGRVFERYRRLAPLVKRSRDRTIGFKNVDLHIRLIREQLDGMQEFRKPLVRQPVAIAASA